MTSAFVTLTYLKVIPFWIAAVVVSRDLILSVGVVVIHVAGGPCIRRRAGRQGLHLCQVATVVSAMLAYYFKILPGLPRGRPGSWPSSPSARGSNTSSRAQAAHPPADPLQDELPAEHDQLRS